MKIDYDVPIPAAKKRTSHPFAEMKRGGSFFVEGATYSCLYGAARAHKIARNPAFVFRVAQRIEGGVQGARIWCISNSAIQDDTT